MSNGKSEKKSSEKTSDELVHITGSGFSRDKDDFTFSDRYFLS